MVSSRFVSSDLRVKLRRADRRGEPESNNHWGDFLRTRDQLTFFCYGAKGEVKSMGKECSQVISADEDTRAMAW